MSTSISHRTSTLALFALCAAALSAPVGCAPVDDVTDETDTQVGELAAGTLNGMVTAYATTNGSNLGPYQSFGPGIYTASAGELAAVGNDLTRLLEIAPAVRVRVCQNDVASLGTCSVYENLTGANLRVAVAAGISRIEVRPLVVAYRDANYGGVATGYEIGRYDSLARIGLVGNDTITSVRFAPGVRATLCTDDPILTVGGTCRTVAANTAQLSGGLDNTISWIDVLPAATGFQSASFTGASQSFYSGVYPVSALSVLGNDTLSSIVVPEGVLARACSDDPTNTIGYTCVTFSKSSLQVPATLDNRTSWLDVGQNVILSPLNEESVYTTTVTLRGYAFSPSGEAIPNARLRWSSNIDGDLGAGQNLTVPLSFNTSGCGSREHVITLTSTDAQGRVFTTRRSVYVVRIC
jgi:hypothetical protein